MSEEAKKAIPRPLVLEMRDAKQEIVGAVNAAIKNRGLPCYIIREILESILSNVKDIERNEIAAADIQYQQALTDAAKAEKAEADKKVKGEKK